MNCTNNPQEASECFADNRQPRSDLPNDAQTFRQDDGEDCFVQLAVGLAMVNEYGPESLHSRIGLAALDRQCGLLNRTFGKGVEINARQAMGEPA
jgi:hypothetical protein